MSKQDKKGIKIACALFVLLIIEGLIVGCGNQDIFDGFTNDSNTFTYAEVKMPDGTIKEGEVYKYADYQSDAVRIKFKDGTDIVTSYNCTVLSKGKVER